MAQRNEIIQKFTAACLFLFNSFVFIQRYIAFLCFSSCRDVEKL